MILALWLALWTAEAGGSRVVLRGDTVESIARGLGDEALAADLRAVNGLPAGAQPPIGTVLRLPDDLDVAVCEPSYVVRHVGAGSITPSGGVAGPLRDNVPILLGTEVCTHASTAPGEPDGYAVLHLAPDQVDAHHDTVTLLPDTCVTLVTTQRIGGVRSSFLRLSKGALTVEAEQNPGEVVVQTPAGIILGRAGGFRVAVEAPGQAVGEGRSAGTAQRAEALDADVHTLAQGAEVLVAEGFGNRTLSGERPGDPHALPPAPTMVSPEADAELRVARFAWTPVERAFGYRLTVRPTDLTLPPAVVFGLGRGDVPGGVWWPQELLLPGFAEGWMWQVTTVDTAGFEGRPSAARSLRTPEGP